MNSVKETELAIIYSNMEQRLLLIEQIEQNNGKFSIIEESQRKIFLENIENSTNPPILKCVIQRADVENKNKRIYPFHVLDKAVKEYMELVQQRRASGELDHPDSQSVSLNSVASMLEKVWWEDKTLYGELKICTSVGFHKTGVCSVPGDKVALYLSDRIGMNLGISSRGLGSVKKVNGNLYVEDDFELVAFDIVASPSAPGAYLMPGLAKRSNNDQLGESKLNENQINSIKKILF